MWAMNLWIKLMRKLLNMKPPLRRGRRNRRKAWKRIDQQLLEFRQVLEDEEQNDADKKEQKATAMATVWNGKPQPLKWSLVVPEEVEECHACCPPDLVEAHATSSDWLTECRGAKCQCPCGCRRIPGRRIACEWCNTLVGPGCCYKEGYCCRCFLWEIRTSLADNDAATTAHHEDKRNGNISGPVSGGEKRLLAMSLFDGDGATRGVAELLRDQVSQPNKEWVDHMTRQHEDVVNCSEIGGGRRFLPFQYGRSQVVEIPCSDAVK